jgi:hypothetical protein
MDPIVSTFLERHYRGKPWPTGPWDGEPDRVLWIDEATGLHCLARRAEMGHWCGYVAVPKTHPLFGKDYNEVDYDKVTPHGGLTYAQECAGDPDRGICHRTDGGDHAWWFGFDCAHAWDYGPGTACFRAAILDHGDDRRPADPAWDETYRTLDYVKRECGKLAAQLAAFTES